MTTATRTGIEVTQEEIAAVYPRIASAIADALGKEAGEVHLSSRLIEDLNAESIDFLDIVFRLERAFQVKIPRGQIVENARGDLPEARFQDKGFVTPVGVERLKAYMSEVPADRFKEPLRTGDIPLLFTVETFAKLVVRALHLKSPGPPSELQGN